MPLSSEFSVNVLDLLYRTGAKIVNISNKKISSMHAQEEDIKTIINDTKNFNDFAKFYTKTLEEHSEEKPNEETNTPENE